MDFYGLKRKQLQELCKKHGIRANMKNVEMADRLTELFQKEEEPEKAGKRGRSCLKNGGEIVEVVDDENVVEDSKEVKKVRFSPENQTFLFERTDPRAVRLLARKKRAVAKLKEKENPIGICDGFEEFGTSVEVSDDLGRVEEPKGRRNLRRGVVISEDGGNLAKLGDKGGNLDRNLRSRRGKNKDESVEMISLMSPCVAKGRNLRRNSRKSVVQAEVLGMLKSKEGNVEVISLLSPCGGDNEERDVAGGNLKRSLRLRGRKANESNVGVVSLLSPCDNKKAKRRRNGKGIVEESGGEGVDIPADEMEQGDDNVTKVSDCNKPKKRGRPRKTVALVEQVKAALVSDGEGCPNEDAVESLPQHSTKKPDPVGSDHLSVISEPETDDLSEEVMAGLEAIPECEKVDVQMPSDDDCPTPSLSRNADEIGSSKDRECSSELVSVSDCNLKDRNASTPSSYIERTSNSPSSCSKSAQDLSGAIPAGEEQPTISLDENEGGLRASETFEDNQNQLLHVNDGGRIMPLSNEESMPAESPSPSKKGENGTVGDNDFQSVNYKDEVDHRMVARLSTQGLEGSNCSTERPVTVETDDSLSGESTSTNLLQQNVSEEVKAVLDAIPEYEKVNMHIPSDDDCPTLSLSRNGGEVGDSKDRESPSELVALSDCNFKDINASTPSSYIEGTSNSSSFCSKLAQELSGAAPAGEQPSITLDEHEGDLRASETFEDNQNQVLDVNIGGRIMQSSNEESMPAESPSPSKKGEIGTVGDDDFQTVNYKDEFDHRMVARLSTPGLERSNCSTERPVAVETDEIYSEDSLSGASEHGCLIAVKPSILKSSGQISSSLLKRDGNLVESETFESNDAPELYSNKTFNQSQEEDGFQELPCVSGEESAFGTSANVDYELNDQVTEQEKGSVYTGPCDSVFKESNQTTPVISIGPVEKGEQSCKETSGGRLLCLASDSKIDFCSQRNKPPYVQPDHADNSTERISENLLCGDDSLHFNDLAGCTSASCVSKSRKLKMDDAAGDFFDVEQKAERFSEANSFSPSSSHKLYVAHSTMSLVDIREESSSVKVAVENAELKVETLANDNASTPLLQSTGDGRPNKAQETPAELHAVGYTFQEEIATPKLSSKVGSSLRSMEEQLDNSTSEQLKQASSSKDFESSLQRLFTEDSTYTGFTRHSTDCQLDASLSEHVANDNERHHMDKDVDQLNANKAEETPAEFHAVGYTFQEELATPELSSKGGSSLRSMEAQLDNSTSEQLKQERSSKDFESSLQRLFTEDSTYTGFTRGSTDFQLDVSLSEHVANDDELLNERSEATQFSMEKPNTIASGDSTEACSLSLNEEPEVAELCLETGDSIQLEHNVDKSQDTSHATQLPPSSSPQLSVAYETAKLEDICEEKDTNEMTYGKAKESASTPSPMEALYENSNIEHLEKANNTEPFKFSLKHLFSEDDIFDTDGNTKFGQDDRAEELQCTRSIRQAAAPKVDASLNEKVADDNECLSMDNLNVKNESLDVHLVAESSEARECSMEMGESKYTKEFASGGSDRSPSMMQNSNSSERAQNLPLELVAMGDNISPEEILSTSINDQVILSDTSHSPVEDQESLNASEPVNCFTVCHTIIATSEDVSGNEELLFGSSSELEGRMTESKASESDTDLPKLPASENEMDDTMLDSESGGGEQLNKSNSEEKEFVAWEGSVEGRVQIQSSSAVKEDMKETKLLPDDAADSEREKSMLESEASVKAGVVGTSISGSRDRGEETSNETTIGSVSCSEDSGKVDSLALVDMMAFKQAELANNSNQPNLQHLVPENNLMNKDEKRGLETETTLGENAQDSVSLLDWNQRGLEFNLSANDNTADLNSLFMEFMANDMGEMFQAGDSIPCMQLEERNHTLDSLCDNYTPHVSDSLKHGHDNKGDMVESEEHNHIGWHSATEMHHEVTSEASLNDMSDIITGQNQAEFAHRNSVQGNCVELRISENVSLCGSEKKAGKTEEMTENLTDGLLMHYETAVLESGNEYKFEEEKNTDMKIVQQNGNGEQVDDHTDTVHDDASNFTIYQLAFEQAIDHTDTVHDDHTDTIHDTFGTSVSDPRVQDEKSLKSEASMLYNVDQATDGTDELGCGLVTNVSNDVDEKGNRDSQNVKTEDAAEDANDNLLLHKRNRSILIHGTPRKPLLPNSDMKENTPALKRLQMVNATATKPLLKRKVLGEIQK